MSPLIKPPLCHLVMPAGCCIASCCPLIAPPSPSLVVSAGCRIASCRPLIVPPFPLLVAPAGCHIASCCPIIAPPSRQLIALACCRVTSPYPLVAPRVTLSSSGCASWSLRHLSTHRPLVILSYLCATSRCLVTPAGCLAIISCCPLVAPPSHPLIVLAGCCVPSCSLC